METYYLIDFENVNEKGLIGCDELSNQDNIIIFFTKAAKKIDMSAIANHKATLQFFKVPKRDQSVDMHIVSYLGYLVGSKNADDEYSIVIISNDTDYDNIIKFWNGRAGIKISKKAQIKPSPKIESTEEQETQDVETIVTVEDELKAQLNKEVTETVREAGLDDEMGNKLALLAVENCGRKHFLGVIHNELQHKYTDYLELYKSLKPVLSRYTYASLSGSDSSVSQCKITISQKISSSLKRAKVEPEIIDFVSSVVQKNIAVENGRLKIYRTIISEYGKNKGLDIYSHIKKVYSEPSA